MPNMLDKNESANNNNIDTAAKSKIMLIPKLGIDADTPWQHLKQVPLLEEQKNWERIFVRETSGSALS